MSRSDQVYLQDIKESIEIILSYAKDKNEYDFVHNLMLQDAVIRRFEIIGEAAGKLSDQFKIQNPDVQWNLLKAMRNKLIHEYFGVSATTIYATIQVDLPVLKEQLQNL
jgi:uncharacterized protein with HEPN domain